VKTCGGHGGNAPEEARIEAFGGVLGVTKGLWTQFGSDRVIDTPITESAIVGMAPAPQQRVCGRWRS
jgi:pyruvate dehydrogenase E1 component beta subunit